MQSGSPEAPPRWELASIYPDHDDRAFHSDLKKLRKSIAELKETSLRQNTPQKRADKTAWIVNALNLINSVGSTFENLESYCYCRYSVATDNEASIAALNRVNEYRAPMNEARVAFRNALAGLGTSVDQLVDVHEELRPYRFLLNEEIAEQQNQMSEAEETLAADLDRAGGDAWSRLQSTLSSQLTRVWDAETGETRTVVELRSLAMHKDREIRHNAYLLELAAWESVEVPMAFAINGVKGFSHILNKRRGWSSTLERSIRQSRITGKTLESLIGAMEQSLPLFQRYFRSKASALGIPRLAFYDLFAPLPGNDEVWTYGEAKEFIIAHFNSFSEEMGSFANRVFSASWIDAEPRKGKVGGAYCIDMPVAGASRILANFDGTFEAVTTLAHELGHAYHSEVLRGLPAMQRQYPMTLAETASLFSETLVFSARIAEAKENRGARAAVLESFLQGAAQVVVDILSRFYFEKRVMTKRASGELSPRELKEFMLDAQAATYGDALSESERHPYMWAVKGHYYNVDFAYYNFPYAFGLLFGLGLFAEYRAAPESFPNRYRELLRETGRAPAEEVAAAAGFDITTHSFWNGAFREVSVFVEEFEKLAGSIVV